MDDLLRIRLEVDGDDDGRESGGRGGADAAESPHERIDERYQRIARNRAQRQAQRQAEQAEDGVRERIVGTSEKATAAKKRVAEAERVGAERRAAIRDRVQQLQGVTSRFGGGSAAVSAANAAGGYAAQGTNMLLGQRLGSKVLGSAPVQAVGKLAGSAAAGYMVAKGGTEAAALADQFIGGGDSPEIEAIRREIADFESWVRGQIKGLVESMGSIRQASLLLGGDPDAFPSFSGIANKESAEGAFKAFMARREGVIRNNRASEQLGDAKDQALEWAERNIIPGSIGGAAMGSVR